MSSLDHIVDRLRSQFTRGEPVLFTGAGFSVEAYTTEGTPIPSSNRLVEAFWRLAFPSDPFDPTTRLGDAFHAASRRNPGGLSRLIQHELTVDGLSLPSFYQQWFSMPWSRCYTLNIDDIELAASRRFSLGQRVTSTSATSGRQQDIEQSGADQLEVIHLNGLVGDSLSDLTFSPRDYGSRQVVPEHWLIQASNDIVARPVVFVGTEIDESTLWQYMEGRELRGPRGTRELRPGSVLVAPALNPAREILLRDLNIDWVRMTAKEFAEEILITLRSSIDQGHSALRSKRNSAQQSPYPPLVSDLLATEPTKSTSYLLGHEPEWADLISGRAIRRECDDEIAATSSDVLKGKLSNRPLVITGTAGSGKSTSLMRLASQLSAEGIATYWIDEQVNLDVYRLRDLVMRSDEPVAVCVDDADLLGRHTTGWARELPTISNTLFACAVRSTRVDGLLDSDTLGGVEPLEISMPPLEDSDIDDLVRVLDENNRLGILKGKSAKQRRDAFRRQAGRQLLVGMIQATSGLRFTEKAFEEYAQLEGVSRLFYGIVAFVHSQRHSLDLDEILTAVGSRDNETLNALDRLVQRGIITRNDRYKHYQARHRVIAEQVINSPIFRSEIKTIIEGLFVALASNLAPKEPRTSRLWRRFIRFINHEFVMRFLAVEDSRQVYGSIETLMTWDYHFWLQRGSLEVQEGDLQLATNYLGQALSLAPSDRLVKAEWSYLLMKKAARLPSHASAEDWFTEGYGTLLSLVEGTGIADPHPYHILGSQTIAWVRSANLNAIQRRNLLSKAREVVESGAQKNPRNEELRQLFNDLTYEWLHTAVTSDESIP